RARQARCPPEQPTMTIGNIAATANMEALDDLYQRWRHDPQSVDASWRCFFEGFDLGVGRPAAPAAEGAIQVGVVRLIMAYRDLGHFLAHLDPLGERRASYSLLELSEFGLGEADLDQPVDTRPFLG